MSARGEEATRRGADTVVSTAAIAARRFADGEREFLGRHDRRGRAFDAARERASEDERRSCADDAQEADSHPPTLSEPADAPIPMNGDSTPESLP